ncbi:MAG TPA: M50 family metallopeptidase [Caulobacteraceae bacterium]|nr:M50 family metallopeptidase [Caulobacteraceae bacterium]
MLPAVALIVIGLSLSIFLHEMSHTLTGRALGMRIDRITLYMFGGVAELQDEPRKGSAEFLMAIAGPALSVLLWWLLRELTPVLIQARAPGMIVFAVNELSRLNLTLAIFNMIPAFPMDGGRVLRSLIWMVTGRVGLATRIAATLGQIFGGLLMLFGAYEAVFEQAFAGGLWMVVLGLMLIGMAKAGRRAAPRD